MYLFMNIKKRPSWLQDNMLRFLDRRLGQDIIVARTALAKRFHLSEYKVDVVLGYWRFS